MSIQYSDTTNYRGILQMFEREIGAPRAFITGNTKRLKEATADVNLAWDEYVEMAIKFSGKWQYDDTNESDYPIVYTNLVSGQRDYTFTSDGGGNLILDIYNVAVLPSATDTVYQEISNTVDQQTAHSAEDIAEERGNTGVPDKYDKTSNGLFLDPAPSYNATSGLKVWINREPSYFATTDTTKKPGCPGIHHHYFFLKPALYYARRNSLENFNLIQDSVLRLEQDIEEYYTRREKDVTHTLKPQTENIIGSNTISF